MAVGITNMTPSVVSSDIQYLPFVIQQNGAFLNTGVTLEEGIGARFSFYSSDVSSIFIFGDYPNMTVSTSSARYYYLRYGETKATTEQAIVNKMITVDLNFKGNQRTIIDGVDVWEITKSVSSGNRSVYFGSANGYSNPKVNKGGLGALEITVFDSIKQIFQPCLVRSTGLVGFQNLQTKEIIGSATSQPFIVPTQDAIDLIDMGVLPVSLQNGQTEQKNELGVI